jgi:hypothetical protein
MTWKPRKPRLRGPSPGLRAWADWIIYVRRRWHEADPPPKPINWRRVFFLSATTTLIALPVTLPAVERLF